jgi:hypothetical protein
MVSGATAMAKKPPLGSGTRFKSLEHELARRGGVKNPAALAASIGRAKYGEKRMSGMSAKGRRGS